MTMSLSPSVLLGVSFGLATTLFWIGGFKEVESFDLVGSITTVAATMAGFGLVAFQIAHASSSIKEDFIETSVLMILSAIFGFFYLAHPGRELFGFNFGEVCILAFFWGFILLLMILGNRRLTTRS